MSYDHTMAAKPRSPLQFEGQPLVERVHNMERDYNERFEIMEARFESLSERIESLEITLRGDGRVPQQQQFAGSGDGRH